MRINRTPAIALLASLVGSALLAADPVEAVFDRAARALSAGEYSAAEQGFLEVLKVSPRNVGALGNLGVVYSRTNRTAKAIEVYDRALKISPGDDLLQLNLGIAYLKQDDHARALPLFAAVVATDPGHRQARELLATCRLYAGDVPTAIRELEALRAAQPHDSGILYLLGVGYIKNKQPGEARAVLDEMFSTAVSPAQTQFLLGKTYYDAAQFSEAEQFFLKAMELDPQLPNVQLELAESLLEPAADRRRFCPVAPDPLAKPPVTRTRITFSAVRSCRTASTAKAFRSWKRPAN